MKRLIDYTPEQLNEFEAAAQKKYDEFVAQGISLNMARGKPAAEQLDIYDKLLNEHFAEIGFKSEDGTDCRNYGILYGIEECRKLFGEILGVDWKNVIACGSSSLNLMFDFIAQGMYKGFAGCEPWVNNKNRKFIAVVPGYDRHFGIAQYFGFELINVPMTDKGPDMDLVEELIKNPDVKGMFCVPKYSNPDGITYSDETVIRLASMKPAAKDFRVIYDNAYIVHDVYEEGDELLHESGDPAFIVTENDGSEYLKKIIASSLSDFERQVIELRLLDKSYAETALVLGCSEKAVDNAIQRIRKKIRSKI